MLDSLEYDKVDANLPASVYLWLTPLAVPVAWLFPRVAQLRSVLFTKVVLALMLSRIWDSGIYLAGLQRVLSSNL